MYKEYREQYYRPALAGSSSSTPLHQGSRHIEPMFTMQNSIMAYQPQKVSVRRLPKQPLQPRILNLDDQEEDLDSDSELDTAPVREAARVRRPTTQKNSPYYSTVIEPQLSLGDQWHGKPKKEGFQKLQPVFNNIQANGVRKKSGRLKPLYCMTVRLTETFEKLNPMFHYDPQQSNPKRILTNPCKPAKNDGYDNEDCDYILRVNEILGDQPDHQYQVIDLLGQGTFGQVVKCKEVGTGKLYSVKVIKNKTAYRAQSRMEVEILKQLNQKLDPEDKHHIVRLRHTFIHKNHLCLSFELLSCNLYELIKGNSFKGLSLNLVRVFTLQLLDTLSVLKDGKIIHCDLKPENVLLQSTNSPTIKVIDFGSACHEANRMYTYIQSRFYRSPEVLLGLQYTSAIDMWSLGCITAELFLGLPLFPGISEYNQLSRIIDMLGLPPQDMLDKGKNTPHLFTKETLPNGKHVYRFKSRDQYNREYSKNEMRGKHYHNGTTLQEIIMKYDRGTPALDDPEREREMHMRKCLLNFLEGVLELNPLKRWTPHQAKYHPFITGEPYTEPYKPEIHMKAAMQSYSSLSGEPSIRLETVHKSDGKGRSESPSLETIRSLESAASAATARRTGEVARAQQLRQQQTLQQQQHQQQQQESQQSIVMSKRPRAQSAGEPTIPSRFQELIQDMRANPIPDKQPSENKEGHSHSKKINTVPSNSKSRPKHHLHARSHGDLIGLLPHDGTRTPTQETTEQKAAPLVTVATMDDDSRDNSSMEKHTIYDEGYDASPATAKRPGIAYKNFSDSAIHASTAPSNPSRRIKYATTLKIRQGSRDSIRMPDEVHGRFAKETHPEAGGIETMGDSAMMMSKSEWMSDGTTAAARSSKVRMAHAGEAAGGLFMMRQEKTSSNIFPSISLSNSSTSISNGGKRVAAAIKRRM